jgi:hypothetical protein
MMAFLLDGSHGCAFEVVGADLMCVSRRLKPGHLPGLLRVLEEFHRHVPKVVWSLYPARHSSP